MTALVRTTDALGYELRAFWARRDPVALRLDERSRLSHVVGRISRVAPTCAFVVVSGIHVPTDAILRVEKATRAQLAVWDREAAWAALDEP